MKKKLMFKKLNDVDMAIMLILVYTSSNGLFDINTEMLYGLVNSLCQTTQLLNSPKITKATKISKIALNKSIKRLLAKHFIESNKRSLFTSRASNRFYVADGDIFMKILRIMLQSIAAIKQGGNDK